jgi:hypothetical protein
VPLQGKVISCIRKPTLNLTWGRALVGSCEESRDLRLSTGVVIIEPPAKCRRLAGRGR